MKTKIQGHTNYIVHTAYSKPITYNFSKIHEFAILAKKAHKYLMNALP